MRRQVRKSKILPMKYLLIYLILGVGSDITNYLKFLAALNRRRLNLKILLKQDLFDCFK